MEYPFNPNDPEDQYAKLYSAKVVVNINELNLARYGLKNYILENPPIKPSKDEEIIISNLSRAGKRLMGFSRTNLFKRLESSGYSFLLSLSRHVLRNFIFVYAIENNSPFPIGRQEANLLDEFLDDEDIESSEEQGKLNLLLDEETYYEKAKEVYQIFEKAFKTKFDWIRSALFEKGLKNELIEDCRAILKILKLGKDWIPEKDRQLNALYDLCTKKFKNEKVLIFTQFADTAYYLINEFKKRNLKSVECVTGDCDDPTEFAYRFSPISNERKYIAGTDRELRVIISTDVLSEGQNLQDAHIVVNYDLPWAIIRLIQRVVELIESGKKRRKLFVILFCQKMVSSK